MGIKNVRFRQEMCVPARIEERACRVHCARGRQQVFEASDVLIGARFIQRAPPDKSRVIAVTAYGLAPLAHETAHRFFMCDIHTPTGKLAPHQITQLVRPVEGARLEDLLVQPRPVEPGCHG